jgi:hypothetical protein
MVKGRKDEQVAPAKTLKTSSRWLSPFDTIVTPRNTATLQKWVHLGANWRISENLIGCSSFSWGIFSITMAACKLRSWMTIGDVTTISQRKKQTLNNTRIPPEEGEMCSRLWRWIENTCYTPHTSSWQTDQWPHELDTGMYITQWKTCSFQSHLGVQGREYCDRCFNVNTIMD